MKFKYENTDVCYVNAIRRIILAEVPNVAIVDDMEFIKNDTSLHNEFMSHRISLIPCCFEKEAIDNFEAGSYEFTINVENTTTNIMNITTKHIHMTNPEKNDDNNDNEKYKRSFTKKIFPPCKITKDYILITRIKPKQCLHVVFRAAKGIAKTHSKWSPVSLCAHHLMLDENEVEKERNIIKEDPSKLNHFDTIDKWRIFKKNNHGEPNKFELNVVSECCMTSREILDTATDILVEKLTHVTKKMTVEAIDEITNMFAVVIAGEDHTLGNVMQATIYNHYIRRNKKVEYCGYFKPHPLENHIILKIKFEDGSRMNISDVIEFFEKAMTKTIKKMPIGEEI
jgi:DNA-directed RNA polymerase subunit L